VSETKREILTVIYSVSKHGTHLRKSTTASRLGPSETRAKTFTVGIELGMLTAVVFWQKKKKK
jgi:tetrahydromethanopterin S-methyltransferase subunit C